MPNLEEIKVEEYLYSKGFIYDRVWQPWWREFLFGKRWAWFGPPGSHISFNKTPKTIKDADNEIQWREDILQRKRPRAFKKRESNNENI